MLQKKKKKREEKLQRLLRRLKKNNALNRLVYGNTDPIGSFPAKTYGLPKIHKFTSSHSFSKLWPTVSSIGT